MPTENHPKVFISYSWVMQEWVAQLAQRLINDGIDTIVDFWNLKPGNDKYKFMESMVTDKTIDFVLIVCDKTYTEKANDRTGGVGDETVIISSELYGKFKQEKFLPLILGKNEDSSPTVPVYIKTRIYFDFSDENNYENVAILSYTAKYASSYYGPFRQAASSDPSSGDRKSYQMDYHNSKEALREAYLDIKEGADMIMVKPALAYLDIIRMFKEKCDMPLVAYNVSGEYAMLKNAVDSGIMKEDVIYETMIAIKRAGADLIITYFAKYLAELLKK